MIKLHLGCGPHYFHGWDNIDVEPHPGIIVHDLRNPLPLDNGSVDYIFSEHFIEHLTLRDGLFLLRECRRVLKPGGVLRVVTPDLEYLIRKYQSASDGGDLINFRGVWEPQTPAQMVNEAMRLWGHQFLYDVSEMQRALIAAGFERMPCRLWHQSPHEALRDLEVRPDNNDLIIEAW